MSAGRTAMTKRKEKNRAADGKTKSVPSTSGIASETLLDITTEVCPMTFVRTRLALDRLPPGATLRVRLRGDEARRSVPQNAASLGHQVIGAEDFADGTAEIVLRTAGSV